MKKINNTFYDTYGDQWYTAFDNPVALLRAESKVKAPWVIERIRKHFVAAPNQIRVLDVGCGAGFLSNTLAQAGLPVTGLDLSKESLAVAEKFDKTKSVKYVVGNAEKLPFDDGSFSVVTAMDFLEHVEDPGHIIRECARVLNKDGLFIFHTFNRNPISALVAIKLVEWLVKNTPQNMHVYNLFIKPQELASYCKSAGLDIEECIGIKPVISSISFKSLFTGIVPASLKFELTKSLLISYMGSATK